MEDTVIRVLFQDQNRPAKHAHQRASRPSVVCRLFFALAQTQPGLVSVYVTVTTPSSPTSTVV
jgi:hypothetical protein